MTGGIDMSAVLYSMHGSIARGLAVITIIIKAFGSIRL